MGLPGQRYCIAAGFWVCVALTWGGEGAEGGGLAWLAAGWGAFLMRRATRGREDGAAPSTPGIPAGEEHSLLEIAPFGVLVITTAGAPGPPASWTVTRANPAARRMLGLPPDSPLPRFDQVGIGEAGLAECAAALRDGSRRTFELAPPDEETGCWLRGEVTRRGDEIVIFLADITEQKRACEQARRERALLEMTGQMTRSGGWEVFHPELKISWSPAAYDLHELPPDFVPTLESVLSFFRPEDRERIATAYRSCLNDGTPLDLVLRFVSARGSRRWVRMMARRDRINGQTRRVMGTFQDVTDQQEALEQSRQNLHLLEKIAATLPCAVYHYVVTSEGPPAFTFLSERIRDIYGRERRDLAEDLERIYELVHPDDVPRVRHAARAPSQDGREWRLEYRIFRNGEMRWILDQAVAETLPGEGVSWVGFLMDVTDRKCAERELVRARDAAEAASRTKSEFLAVMSHEIRTPMNGVLGFAELLAAGNLGEEAREYVHTIQQSGEAMLRIINDILDYSRIEAGRMEIDLTTFTVQRVVDDVCGLLEPNAASKGLRLHAKVGGGVPERIVSDEARLRQVLLNLTSNAVKFTHEGSVRLDVEATEDGIGFSVTDTGEGMDRARLDRVFEPFTQADSSIARRFGGTGLGLTIAHRLVRLLGGELQVTSELGRGSRFFFTLPSASGEAEASPVSTPTATLDATFAESHPLRVLVVEDDAVNRRLVCRVLSRLGYEAGTANDGAEAVAAWREVGPDCILMDMQMPGVDGLEATRRIREIESIERPPLPVYISALTANVLPAERQRCLQAGMDDYISKPLRVADLTRVLEWASARLRTSGVRS